MKRPKAQYGDLPQSHVTLRVSLLVLVVAAFIAGTVLLLGTGTPERLVSIGGVLWSAARDWVFTG